MSDYGWHTNADAPDHENHCLCITETKTGKRNYVLAWYSHKLERWASGMNSNVVLWRNLEPAEEVKA